MLIELMNGLTNILYVVAYGLTMLLPETPFQFESVSWGPFGDAIGLVFPVVDMGIHMTVILSAFLIYYAIRWLLRLIKQVQ